jgi:hypothetical protein
MWRGACVDVCGGFVCVCLGRARLRRRQRNVHRNGNGNRNGNRHRDSASPRREVSRCIFVAKSSSGLRLLRNRFENATRHLPPQRGASLRTRIVAAALEGSCRSAPCARKHDTAPPDVRPWAGCCLHLVGKLARRAGSYMGKACAGRAGKAHAATSAGQSGAGQRVGPGTTWGVASVLVGCSQIGGKKNPGSQGSSRGRVVNQTQGKV